MDHIDYGTHIAYRTDQLSREAGSRRLSAESETSPAPSGAERPLAARTAAILVTAALVLGAIAAPTLSAAQGGTAAGGHGAGAAAAHR